MIRYLLDTNIVSELTKPAPSPACVAWLEENGSASGLSAITLAELKYGIERLAEGKH